MIDVQNGVANATVEEAVLFPFDNHSIPFSTGLRLQLIPGKTPYNKPPIILRSGSPGEPDDQMVCFYGTVIDFDGELRMWYQSWSSQDSGRRLGYAVSQDGVNWEKPKLGLVEFNGSKENNIIDLFDGQPCLTSAPVLYDPDDPDPNRRFKMCIEADQFVNSLAVAYSADGLRWRASPNNPVGPAQETGSVVKHNGCYYVTSQDELGYHGSHFGIARKMVTFASYDFETWTQASCLSFSRDNVLPRPMEPYHNMSEEAHQGAMLWSRGNVIIGVYDMWHGNPMADQSRIDMDLGLVVSNDALRYREPIPDFKLIPATGELEQPNRYGKAITHGHGPAMVNHGDQTMMWYGMIYGNDIRLATWHRDRLGCFETFDEMIFGEGEFFPITRPRPHFISCPLRAGDGALKLFANADLNEHCPLTVEVLDEGFHPLPGYSGDACVPLAEDGFRQPVRWKERDELPAGETFRLQVNYGDGLRPEDAKVYALYVAKE